MHSKRFEEWSTSVECPRCERKGRCKACPEGTGTICWYGDGGTWGHLWRELELGQQVFYRDPPANPNTAKVQEAKREHSKPKTPKVSYPVGTSGELDRVYSRWLELCPLTSEDMARLASERGLIAQRVADLRIGRLPGEKGQKALLVTLEREFGRDLLLKVPGILLRRGRLAISAAGSGFLVPVGPSAGEPVTSLQLRLDEAIDGERYRLLSGGDRGAKSLPEPYTVKPEGSNPRLAVLTEGWGKALAGADRFGGLAIGVPGVSQWSLALPVLKAAGAKEVLVAWDTDHKTKPQVFRPLRAAVEKLRREGYTVRLLLWPAIHKGIDDALTAGAELEELEGEQVDQHLREVAELLGLVSEAAGQAEEAAVSTNLPADKATPDAPAPKEDSLSTLLEPVTTLKVGYAVEDLQAALRQVGAAARRLDSVDRACLQSELQRELKRIKAPTPADLAKSTVGKANDTGEEGALLATPPCDEEVSGPEILDQVESFICRHISLPEGASVALALWVAHTYLIPRLTFSPRLAIQSPVKGCGKTTLLTLLAFLVEKPSPSAWPSTAALFREVEAFAPTLLLDEFDTWIHENEEIRGVINSGFFKPFAYVTRCEGDEHRVKRFNTFAAMALSGINKLPSTIQDRSIVISLRKKTAADQVGRVRMTEAHTCASAFKPRLARWAADVGQELEDSAGSTEVPGELEDRPADLWRPLLAIANLAGGSWPARARTAAVRLSGRHGDDEDPGIMLLQDIREAFNVRDVDSIRSESLLEDLHRMSERPWRELSKGKPLSANRLGAMLRAFGVHSGKIRFGDRTFQGYKRADFNDAFKRYLFSSAPPSQSGTVEHDSHGSHSQAPEGCSDQCSGSTCEAERPGTPSLESLCCSDSDVEQEQEPEHDSGPPPSRSHDACSTVPLCSVSTEGEESETRPRKLVTQGSPPRGALLPSPLGYGDEDLDSDLEAEELEERRAARLAGGLL